MVLLPVGAVLTVEPGLLHSRPRDRHSCRRPCDGIGVRIEDDVLVTADGIENLTAATPKTVAEVEAACAAGDR